MKPGTVKSNPSPRELANVSRQVNGARREYELARAKAARALARACSDGTSQDIEALREADRRESVALDGFMEMLRVLHDSVGQRVKRESQ